MVTFGLGTVLTYADLVFEIAYISQIANNRASAMLPGSHRFSVH